jgi:chromosome segregation ATPase
MARNNPIKKKEEMLEECKKHGSCSSCKYTTNCKKVDPRRKAAKTAAYASAGVFELLMDTEDELIVKMKKIDELEYKIAELDDKIEEMHDAHLKFSALKDDRIHEAKKEAEAANLAIEAVEEKLTLANKEIGELKKSLELAEETTEEFRKALVENNEELKASRVIKNKSKRKIKEYKLKVADLEADLERKTKRIKILETDEDDEEEEDIEEETEDIEEEE